METIAFPSGRRNLEQRTFKVLLVKRMNTYEIVIRIMRFSQSYLLPASQFITINTVGLSSTADALHAFLLIQRTVFRLKTSRKMDGCMVYVKGTFTWLLTSYSLLHFPDRDGHFMPFIFYSASVIQYRGCINFIICS